MLFLRSIILSLALTAACGENGGSFGDDFSFGPGSNKLFEPPPWDPTIVGDWFVCREPDCEDLSFGGFRCEPDGGLFYLITIPRSRKFAYCEQPRRDVYRYENSQFSYYVLLDDGRRSEYPPVELIIDGDRARVPRDEDWDFGRTRGPGTWLRRVSPTFSIGPCR